MRFSAKIFCSTKQGKSPSSGKRSISEEELALLEKEQTIMKITQKQFNPILIVLETPEEVQIMLDALNKYAQTSHDERDGQKAGLMYNQLFFHARLLS